MKAKSAEILARHGLTQRFRMGITGFLAAGWVVAETDCLWLCMRSLARRLEKYLPVEIHEVPFDIPPVQVVQVWHERSHTDPAHAWLRRKVHEVFRPT